MGARGNGNVLLRDVNADGETFGVDVREMMFRLLRVFMRHVKADVVDAVDFHFLVDGTRHDVTRGQGEAFVVFLHKLLAVWQAKDAAVTAHGLRDEIGRMRFSRMEERRWVELDKFHVLHRCLGTIGHGNAVARGDVWIGGSGINRSAATSGQHRDTRENGVDFLRVGVEHISTVTFNVGRTPRHFHTQMVLRDDFHGEMVFQQRDVRRFFHRLDESALNFEARVVSMMENAKFGVSALAVEVERTVFILVEVHAPL